MKARLALGLLVPCLVVVACGDDSTKASGGNGTGTTPPGATLPPVAGPGAQHAGCRIFPNDNPWNQDASGASVDTALMSSVFPHKNPDKKMHPDWGKESDGFGIPVTAGKGGGPAKITFSTDYGPRESDKLACAGGGGDFCYPIPANVKTEGGGDRHVLFLDQVGAPDHCTLFELYAADPQGSGYEVGSAAIFKLDSNALRPEGFTSADAAGLPIMPGLVRREEIDREEIPHALRFTMGQTRNGYIHPATHAAGDANDGLPPMGLRLRLKAGYAETGLSNASAIIVRAMKKYGIILADNGSDWYVSGEMSEAWAPDMDDLVEQIGKIKGSDFEIVKTGDIIPQPD